jgi:hypothetical protein
MSITIAWGTDELVTQYNYLSSGHFFDRDAMRFFNSRLTGNYKRIDDSNALFITTEKAPNGKRMATIRKAQLFKYTRESDGRECFKINIHSVTEFNTLTLPKAKKLLSLMKGE